MNIFIIENSYFGILSAIFYSYVNKIKPDDIYINNYQMQFNLNFIEIPTNIQNAERVDKKIKEILISANYKYLINAIRSNNDSKFKIIFNYLIKIINANKDVSNNFADDDIYAYTKLISPIFLEVHRFLGFIRFVKSREGIYYSAFEPDNDIAELILPHFIKRYKSMPFILHDVKHNVIIGYNGKEYKIVNKKIPKTINVNDEIDKLFKKYYQTINIPSRKNLKQMYNYMPKRYHKNLIEKNELI